MIKVIKIAMVVCWCLYAVLPVWAGCPSADFTGNCKVDLEDLAAVAGQWLDEGVPYPTLNGMTWVSIDDPGVSGHEGFTGDMSKYETTHAQYCEYLNAALASGVIAVSGSYVQGSSGPYAGQNYYRLDGPGLTIYDAVNGGKSRILYSGGHFSVESGFENHPVTYVSWYGAMAFASFYGWRLPTEWQWRAAADYDGSYPYGCGTTINSSNANYYISTHPYGTTEVGAFGTYGYGLCDMAGNVSEWTNSCFYSDCRDATWVSRGGSWYDDGYSCLVSFRSWGLASSSSELIGFRVCR